MPTDVPDTDAWKALTAQATRRIAGGEHPDDATWNTVMTATADDDALLDELWRTCPDDSAYHTYDYDSEGAEKQSLVLGNLASMVAHHDR